VEGDNKDTPMYKHTRTPSSPPPCCRAIACLTNSSALFARESSPVCATRNIGILILLIRNEFSLSFNFLMASCFALMLHAECADCEGYWNGPECKTEQFLGPSPCQRSVCKITPCSFTAFLFCWVLWCVERWLIKSAWSAKRHSLHTPSPSNACLWRELSRLQQIRHSKKFKSRPLVII